MSRAAAAVIATTGLVLGLAGCATDRDAGSGVPVDAVATVDGRPITVADAAALVVVAERPPVLRPGDPLPDPRQEAVEHAVRSELFAREAVQRRLDVRVPPGASERSARASALIHHERSRTAGLTARSIDEAAARRWYAGHRSEFDHVADLTVDWARVDDPALARRLLATTTGQDRPTFGRLRARPGVRGFGTGTVHESVEDLPEWRLLIARAAFAVRTPGGTGMVADRQQRWWLVRVHTIRATPVRWTPELATTVRTAMTTANETRHLDRLDAELRSKWAVELYDDRVAAVPLPATS